MDLTLTHMMMNGSVAGERPGVYGLVREHARGVFGSPDDRATDRREDVSDSIVDVSGGSRAGGGEGVEEAVSDAGAYLLGEDILCQV